MAKKKATRKRAPRRQSAKKKSSATTTRESVASAYDLSDDEIEDLLLSGEKRDLLEGYFGEEGYLELQALASRARSRSIRSGARVLILPGLMGSKLGQPRAISLFTNTIWFDPVDIALGSLSELTLLGGSPDIVPIGVFLFTYLQIKLRLRAAGFNASFHPFDWRQSIDLLGQELARRVREETEAGQSEVYLVAHSMGGLVGCAAIRALDDDAEKIQRLVMLGTPNFGSFVPVQALRATHRFVRQIAALDLRHTAADLAGFFGTFPGLYQMLPAPEKFSAIDLFDPATWPATGPRPRGDLLRAAPSIHQELAPGNDQMSLIAGIEKQTVTGISVRDGEFVYELTARGDGTVPLDFAQLPNVTTYFIEESHGSLPNNSAVIRSVVDLLETGETSRLPTAWTPRRRGVVASETDAELAAVVPFGEREGEAISQSECRKILADFAAPLSRRDEAAAVSTSAARGENTSDQPIIIGRRRQHRIDLRLAHGSITEVDARAVVLGLFRGVAPSGAASAIDKRIEGAITEFTDRRMFSGNVGEIFIMPAGRHQIRPEVVVFAGMGSFDEFDDDVLRLTAENVARTMVTTKVDEFATVLMGAGSGIGMRDSLSSLVEGFFRGLLDADTEHRTRSITLCEMDSDRFEQMKNEMLRLATTPLFDDVEVTVELAELPAVPTIAADRRIVPADGTDPVYLIVRNAPPPNLGNGPANGESLTVQASLLTSGDKATVVTDCKSFQRRDLLEHLQFIETNAFNIDALPAFGEKLADMVLPDSIRRVLKAMQEKLVIVIHDDVTSRVPWETICLDGWFPAGQAGLCRKYAAENMSVAKWLEQRRLTNEIQMLLVVNPTQDLSGAEAEGDRIHTIFQDNPLVQIRELRGRNATWSALRAELRSGKYDVVHYAGHAYFDDADRSRSGVLCHGRKVLSGADLAGLGRLPALMFFNACELARVRSKVQRRGGAAMRERIERNVGLAEALLRGGVTNYVGTYWPVSDSAAKEFANTFYGALINEDSIGKALAKGRSKVRGITSVDWADYIHYGSPGFQLKRRSDSQ